MTERLRRELEASLEGDVRFDTVTRALYSTDASVYQIEPTGVVIVRTRDDVVRTIDIARRHGVPITARGGGTSQAGQAIGAGLQLDTAKYFNRVLEVNVAQRWARVEPGIVLDELNAHLRPHRLKFAPDISTANRATVGGMISNNSSGARSVLYGKTIDHVLDLHVALSDGTIVHLRPLAPDALDAVSAADTLEGRCYHMLRRLGVEHAAEVDRRYPKILRRVGGYNLDAFTDPARPFNMAHLIVGSEGTLGLVVEARVNLVPLPNATAVLTIEFDDLLDALGATPALLAHRPAAIEVMDRFILDHARKNPTLDAVRRSVLLGDTPGALLCVELYADDAAELPDRLEAIERDLVARGIKARTSRALDPAAQARIWQLRQSSLGLSMAMKGDAKSVSFVEDTAVAPERLRDYIARFLEIVRRHGSTTGVYAHASVGCLHVRPVINLKTDAGVHQFEAIANDIADLVLEFEGALSGEHGDGLVRGPFTERMFGAELYAAFRTIKRTFDPAGLFNPGKIVDAPPLTANLRYGAGYRTPEPITFFDYGEHGGLGRAVEMCSGIGACRKTLDGTMCPSYMATRDEAHSTRGRANALRLAMTGRLGGNRSRRRGCVRHARPLSGMPRLQGGVSGRRGHGPVQERVSRRLLWAARHSAPSAGTGPDPRALGLGEPVRPTAQSLAHEPLGASGERASARAGSPSRVASLDHAHVGITVARPAGPFRPVIRRAVQRHIHELLPSGDRDGRRGAVRRRRNRDRARTARLLRPTADLPGTAARGSASRDRHRATTAPAGRRRQADRRARAELSLGAARRRAGAAPGHGAAPGPRGRRRVSALRGVAGGRAGERTDGAHVPSRADTTAAAWSLSPEVARAGAAGPRAARADPRRRGRRPRRGMLRHGWVLRLHA